MPTINATAEPAINRDLKMIHTELVAIAADLDAAVGQAKTTAEVNIILDELMEVTLRVTSVGRQLFTQETAKLKTLSKAVLDGTADAKKAIKKLDDIKAFVKGVTKFLGLVDKLVDTAKLVV